MARYITSSTPTPYGDYVKMLSEECAVIYPNHTYAMFNMVKPTSTYTSGTNQFPQMNLLTVARYTNIDMISTANASQPITSIDPL